MHVKGNLALWSEPGQIRIGRTDYSQPNDVYLKMWRRRTVPAMRHKPWLKGLVNAATGANNLVDCAWPFSSFGKGKATKGNPTELDGKPVIPVDVTDDEVEGASTPSTWPLRASRTR